MPIIVSNDGQKVSNILQTYDIDLLSLIDKNNHTFEKSNNYDVEQYKSYIEKPQQGISYYSPLVQAFIKGELSPTTKVNRYLVFCNKFGKGLIRGINIVLPVMENGSVNQDNKYYYTSLLKLGNGKIYQDIDRSSGLIKTTEATGNSYFQRVFPTDEKPWVAPLPVIPTEFSETNTANWNPVSLMGRSVDYQIYTGSSRTVSFTLQLHQELYVDTLDTTYNNIYNLVALIESSCYPYYQGTNSWAGPPQVTFKIGDQFYIKGILQSCSATWKAPFDNVNKFRYKNCDLSITVQETTGPYGAQDIYNDEKGVYNGDGSGIGSYREFN